ncbi:MAG: energy-coupling factor transporter transmembrane component T [Eubacteriales bacterium]|nr:energy-coupling factor transporter transmembrane component T [Eubacteriales bacterium]
MRYFEHLHPLCILLYFIATIGLTLTCFHPVMLLLSILGAFSFLLRLKGARGAARHLRFVLPLFLLVAVGNPLINHRGVTLLGMLFDQWITLEAICYGVTAGLSLAALILWFACYSEVMTSDKFLYLFGKAAPSSALLVTMALQLVPKLDRQLSQIRQCQEMLRPEKKTLGGKLGTAVRHTSTLVGWSMENAVEQADSMKARGYGLRRRTTFHLFHFETRDACFLAGLLALAGACVIARSFGHGYMEFYPRMDAVITGDSGIVLYVLFALLAFLPAILEGREAWRWRSYGLIR